jgi:cytochrome c oxidase cbb3-type subunit 3
MASLQATRALHAPKASVDPESEEKTLRQLVSDTKRVSHGGEIFSAKCAPCHGAQGQGLVGPNLTDDHWIHGGTAVAIKGIVVNGVLAKGMLAWNAVLKPDEIDDVVAYVISLRGTNPVGAKAPEGAEFKG